VAKAKWSDAMILRAVRDKGGLTAPARARALVLARKGLLNVAGTWFVTAAGHDVIAGDRAKGMWS